MSKSGVILVLLGGVLLANNFGWLQWGWLRQWWPVLLIALGLWSIFSNKSGDRPASRDSDKRS